MIDTKVKEKEDKFKPETIIISGSARLPEETTAKHIYGCFTIELEINPIDSKIVGISCVIEPSLAKKIISQALLGRKVEEGIKSAITELEKRFFSPLRKAVIAGLEDVYRGYKKYLKGKKG